MQYTARSRHTYMSAGTLGAQMIIPGPRRYMQLKDIISAEIGWNATCKHLTHMKIHLKRKILTEACVWTVSTLYTQFSMSQCWNQQLRIRFLIAFNPHTHQ